jgi:hypothetical protein
MCSRLLLTGVRLVNAPTGYFYRSCYCFSTEHMFYNIAFSYRSQYKSGTKVGSLTHELQKLCSTRGPMSDASLA